MAMHITATENEGEVQERQQAASGMSGVQLNQSPVVKYGVL